MKAVIQRVLNASVAVEGQTISSVGQGLLVLIGIDKNDEPSDATTIIKKILNTKLFDGEDGTLWKRSVKEIEGEVLCVSQFTLFATFKGLKPDFRQSMSTIPGKAAYVAFMDEIRSAYETEKIQEGRFGAMMAVSLTNDGPTTILLDSNDTRKSSNSSNPSGTSTPVISEETKIKAEEVKKQKEAKKALFESNRLKNEEKRVAARTEIEEKKRMRELERQRQQNGHGARERGEGGIDGMEGDMSRLDVGEK